MTIKRQITKDGKLDIISELVGGPQDGLLVSNEIERVRVPIRKPSTCEIISDDCIPTEKPDSEIGEYERVSVEKLIYKGKI